MVEENVAVINNFAPDTVVSGNVSPTRASAFATAYDAPFMSYFVGGLAPNSTMAELQPSAAGITAFAGAGATYSAADIGNRPGAGGGVTQTFMMDAIPFDRFVFNSLNNTTATVTLKGQGTTGDSIQIRGASAGGSTAWSAGATVNINGDWTATLSVPLAQWDEWYEPEARIGTDDGTKLTGTNTFGCGHIVGILGQSEIEYMLSAVSTFNTFLPQATALAEENIVFTGDRDLAMWRGTSRYLHSTPSLRRMRSTAT